MERELESVKKVLAWFDLLFLEESYMKWAVYFMALTRQCDKVTTREICRRFELTPQQREIVQKGRFEAEICLNWIEKNVPVINSVLFEKLAAFKTELVLSMMAKTRKDAVKKAISHFFTHLRYIRPSVRGRDLKEMGYAPGPVFRDIITAIHHAKLNGKLRTREDELAFARNYGG